jgi:hypothetical protein
MIPPEGSKTKQGFELQWVLHLMRSMLTEGDQCCGTLSVYKTIDAVAFIHRSSISAFNKGDLGIKYRLFYSPEGNN